MFKNYVIVALRNLRNDRTSSLINLIGLSAGMACCMLISIYIKDELSFNKFNIRLHNIYRVNRTSQLQNETVTAASTPMPLGPAIAREIPQVRAVTRLYQRSGAMQLAGVSAHPYKKFQEQGVFFAENSLFSVFSISFLSGDARQALLSPNTVVITDEMAIKYFDTENAVGKTILYDTKTLLQVVAVVKKLPVNSDLQFDFLISFDTFSSVETPFVSEYIKNDWTFDPVFTFCLLQDHAQSGSVDLQLDKVLKKHGDSRKAFYKFSLQPLDDIHLYASDVRLNPSTGSIRYIYIFSAISLLILLIAAFNFINLATARAGTRSKEVGMRKVLGASKTQLVIQFLGETLLLSFLALLLSFLLASQLLPVLNDLTSKQLSAGDMLRPSVLMWFVLVFVLTGLLSGLYPAFFIARFQPVLALKGRSGEVSKRNLLRKTLLVSQFTVSVILIVGAMVIYRQIRFIRNKPLGFNKEQVLVVPIFGSGSSSISYAVDGPMRLRMNTFAGELTKYSRVKSVTAASALPGQGYIPGLIVPEGFRDKDNLFAPWASVDYNFVDAFEIPLVAGRNFSKSKGTDHLSAFILSESAVRYIGWKSPAEAIGKTMIRGDETNGKKGLVIGVIKDYNFNTLDQPMQPLILDVSASRFTQFAIHIQPDHVPATIAFIEGKWNEMFPERVFEFSFLDGDIQTLYRDKENLSKVIMYFAGIAIFLSCLGLFSLASFLSSQRSKEIGVRKVLGATVPDILRLLSGSFLTLILLALAIAFPVAWYLSKAWLDNYAYRIELSWWIFAFSAVVVISITVITIGLQSIKAAMVNPIKSLRTE